jgi:quercetin dioxygenase-like cupin family protein
MQKPCAALFEDAQIRIARCTFPPGSLYVRHSHPGYLSYVLSGGGQGRIQGKKATRQIEVRTDTIANSPPIHWHELTNTGDTTLPYLIIERKYEPVNGAEQTAGNQCGFIGYLIVPEIVPRFVPLMSSNNTAKNCFFAIPMTISSAKVEFEVASVATAALPLPVMNPATVELVQEATPPRSVLLGTKVRSHTSLPFISKEILTVPLLFGSTGTTGVSSGTTAGAWSGIPCANAGEFMANASPIANTAAIILVFICLTPHKRL